MEGKKCALESKNKVELTSTTVLIGQMTVLDYFFVLEQRFLPCGHFTT